MLERKSFANGVVAYQSPLLAACGVVHAFSTRVGGVSRGAFAAMNLGNPGEGEKDAHENIVRNFELLQEAIGGAVGGAGAMRAWVKQVHGRRVELLEREPEGEYAETLEAEVRDRWSGQMSADGIVSSVAGVMVTVRVADCVPVLLATGDGKIVAAVHAGWRGIVGNVIERAVRVMREAGAIGEVVAAVGPAISAESFEVGEEVAKEFGTHDLGGAVLAAGGGRVKPHVDLQGAAMLQLKRCGVERADGNDLCTYRDAGEFFSHRREKGRTGRMAGVIMAAN